MRTMINFLCSIYLEPNYAHLALLKSQQGKKKNLSYGSYLSISGDSVTLWACTIRSQIQTKANEPTIQTGNGTEEREGGQSLRLSVAALLRLFSVELVCSLAQQSKNQKAPR